MLFPVVTYRCQSWTTEKTERWRTDAAKLWCWRRLLRVPWTARRSNQSILKELNPEYTLEGLMLKLKLQYFGHLMWRTDSLEKILMQGKTEGKRRRGLNGHESEQTLGDSGGQRSLHSALHGVANSQTQFSDWATTTHLIYSTTDGHLDCLQFWQLQM